MELATEPRADATRLTQPSKAPDADAVFQARVAESDKPDDRSSRRHVIHILTWTPTRLRYDPANPPNFGYLLNFLYALSATITVANLYYNQPVLNKIAETFSVSFERASSVATLMQSGYAAGLLFLCPLGDTLRRRPFIIGLVWATAMLWLGLCVTKSFKVFCALSFICGATTVTPQLMLPLVGDIAPPQRKTTAMAIVASGLMFGMLVARLLSGIVANYTDWINIYWLSFGAQYILVVLLFCFMPDYPPTNPEGINYFRVLWSIVAMIFTEPILVQACLITFLCNAIFTNFWTTLTFLLASPPYEFSSLIIGLFSLIGLTGIVGTPLYTRLVFDRFVPLFSTILGLFAVMTGVIVGTFTGKVTVAGPIIQAALADVGTQVANISNRAAIYTLDPKARNRINTAYMISAFCGQLTGTTVGNRLYAHGGWLLSGGASVAFVGLALLAGFARGPRAKGWVGWHGGWRLRIDQ